MAKRVKLPRVVVEEVDPPTDKQTLAILERVGERWLLPLLVLEQTAMRAGEAAKLVWGDVDVAESKFRLPRRSTKSRRPRWVQVPEWLMEHVAATCPLEDRTAERHVFPRFSVDGGEKAMRPACKAGQIPRFTPHQLRHRRATRWHQENVPAKALAERLGHADAIPDAEPLLTRSRPRRALARVARGAPGVVSVWHGGGIKACKPCD
jgi:integrase